RGGGRPVTWSLVLAAGGVLGLYLAGRKNLWGWAIGLAMQALWIAYAIVTEQYGFLLSAVAYGWVYGLNLGRWAREAEPHVSEPCVRCGRCLCAKHKKPKGRWRAPSGGGY